MHQISRRTLLLTASAGLTTLVVAPGPSVAASGPISYVVPFPPGGSIDTLIRILAEATSNILGTQVIVDNKAGGAAIVAGNYVAKAPPDGRTYLVGSNSSLVHNIAMFADLSYDPVKDFAPVIKFAQIPMTIVSRVDLPFKTLDELISYAKANPGKINRASAGISNITNVGFLRFEKAVGIETTHVPFAGDTPALTALLSGAVDIHLGSAPVIRQAIRDGKLRGLAVMGPKRYDDIPDVKTLRELGYKDLDVTAWFVLVAPAATPKEEIVRVNAAFNRALKDPKILEKVALTGNEPGGGTVEEAEEFLLSERDAWIPVLKAANIKG